MKKHSILRVVLFAIVIVALCSWIFPGAEFQDVALVEGDRMQAGLFDLFAYPMVALQYFGNIALYVLVCGMFYGVAYRIPAYRQLVQRIVDGFQGIEHFFLGVSIIVIATIVSVSGISVPIIFVFPFVIDVILKMGYNRLVAATVTVGATIAGIAGTTLGVMTTGYMNQVLEITSFDEMISKVVILVIFVVLLIAQVVLYGKKTKNVAYQSSNQSSTIEEMTSEEEISVVSEDLEEEQASNKEGSKRGRKPSSDKASKGTKKSDTKAKSTSKRGRPPKNSAAMAKDNSEVLVVPTKKEQKANIWPFVIIFDLVIIILAISVFDWFGLFEITWFEDATKAVMTYEIGGFQIFGKLLGEVNQFGQWNINIEVPALIMIATCVLALVYRVKWDTFIEGICDGFKRALEPAIVMLLTYVVLVVVTYHSFQLAIIKFLLDLTSGINVVTMTLAGLLSSLFNIDLSYVTQNVLPYVRSVITDSQLYPLLGVIFQSVYGLTLLIAPTSFLLMGVLSYLDISYKQWVKYIWKLFLCLLAILVVIFLIVLAI